MRPQVGDYNPYYQRYIDNVTGEVLVQMKRQAGETYNLLNSIPEEQGDYRYAEGKWSIKEVTGHLIDGERILAYRALAISRGEMQPLPGWNENSYTPNGNFGARSLHNLAEELRLLREANLLHFKNLTEEQLNKRGTANNSEVTVRALLHIITGHEAHHIKILKERYLKV